MRVRACMCVCVCVAEFYYSEKGTEEAFDRHLKRAESGAFERFSL